MTSRRLLGALLSALLLSACGTTVPLPADRAIGGDGLGAVQGSPTGSAVGGPDDVQAGLGAVGAAAGSPSGGARSGSPATGGTGTQTGSGAPGGAEGARGPIKVGIITADYAGLVASVGGGALPDTSEIPRVLVRGLNSRGGLAGRQIEAVYYKVDGGAPDYSSQYQAACDTFTRDNKVEAVIAQDGIDLLWSCLLKAGIPAVIGFDAVNTDSTARRAFPNVFQPAGMPADRIARAAIEQSVETGWLTSKNRLGVITSGCPWGTRVYNDIIVPAARRHRVAVERFALDCPTPGAAMLGQYSSSIQGAALQFRSNGVDRVLYATENDAAAYVFFTRNADSQRWYPGYLGGSIMGARGWSSAGVTSKEQAQNTRGVSWNKADVDTPIQETPEMRACLDLARAGGAPSGMDAGTAGLYYGFCDAFLPLQLALERSNGRGGLAALRPAMESLGSAHRSANLIDGVVELTPDRHEGAKNAAFFAFIAECACFRHTTTPKPT